jgi:O-methyltransferase involved in polyketide biosynthesis
MSMALRQSIRLGEVQESLLVPLYARSLDSRRKRPILNDPKAVEMVESIDWDFQRFNQRWRMTACLLRTAFRICAKVPKMANDYRLNLNLYREDF